MKYRHDIDGLRAVAVVAVVLFHLGIDAMAGGYAGVDVFFVISGFLITSIVARKIEHGAFSLRGFYLRRVRRLVPPLLATVMVTTVGAAALFVPFDMVAYARSAVAAVLSVSNFVFFAEAGYWDSSTDLKPLLHTWSLGVEEQFYAFWPVLLIGIVRIRRRISTATSLSLLAVFGFLGSLWIYTTSPEAAFYLIPARVWQFAVGALVGQISQPWLTHQMRGVRGTATATMGLASIAASVLTFDASTPFPGVHALLPTIGTALAITGGVGGRQPVVARLLENTTAQWLGRVSYAMYLVHWPVISLYRYATDTELSVAEQIGLGAATVVGTVILHHGIERRFYLRGVRGAPAAQLGDRRLATRILGVSAVIAVVMVQPWLGDGWAWRTPDAVLSVDQIEAGKSARFDLIRNGCNVLALEDSDRCDMQANSQVLVLGNSHEPDGYNFIHAALSGRDDVNLISFGTTNRCGLTETEMGWTAEDQGCNERVQILYGDLAFQLDAVVYAANRPFASNKDVLLQMIADLEAQRSDLHVVVLGGYINTDVPCPRLVNETGTSRACAQPDRVTYGAASPEAQGLYDEFMSITDVFIDRRALLCESPQDVTTCLTETPEGVPMSYDQHHSSLEFALDSGRRFAATGRAIDLLRN